MKADCHIHFVLDGINWKAAIDRHKIAPALPFLHQALAKYREQGYTYLRDGGDRWGVGAAARELAPEYGISYATPLAPLCKKGHYGSFIGETYENLREYAALVEKNRRSGGDFIKIMISGLMDFNRAGVLTEEGLPPGEIAQLIHIAHEEGFAVMAHCNGSAAIAAAAAAGVDSIEHGAYANDDALQTMAAQKTVWVPTLSTVANLRGTGRFDEDAVAAIFENASQNVKKFAAMGGLLAPGSDAGAWAVPHGCDTEYSLFHSILGDDALKILSAGVSAVKEKFHHP
ncbi:MAG: Xaa-Pro dipeptidase [Ruminococcaceae bacterium]|nr:Xaa-Pro dipeptidase [Oscillospiraceae bacterium]